MQAMTTLPVRPLPWIRDFALVGAVTGFSAPYWVVNAWTYASLTGLGGAVGGAALGAFSAWLLSGRARRWPRFSLLLLGPLFGAAWGATAALTTGVSSWWRELLWLSVALAAVAGALQLGWFWLAYAVRRVNQRSTWPVTVGAAALGGGLGWAALFAFGLHWPLRPGA